MQKPLIVLLAVTAAVVAAALFIGLGQPEPPKPPPPPKPLAAKPSAVPIPHREEIMDQAQLPPTDDDLEEEARQDAEQVLDAVELLKSQDPQVRIEGIEQLGAYPTPDAERQLVLNLSGDPDAEVRSAAADALGQFERLEDTSQLALLKALQDSSEDVQAAALGTLESLVDDGVAGSKQQRHLLQALKKKAAEHGTSAETRKSIQEFLQDQAEAE